MKGRAKTFTMEDLQDLGSVSIQTFVGVSFSLGITGEEPGLSTKADMVGLSRVGVVNTCSRNLRNHLLTINFGSY